MRFQHRNAAVLLALLATTQAASAAAPIDRQAVVTRHAPQLKEIDPLAPLSVGNGRFAFTADVTGLQTLPEHYHAKGIPLETQARWSWHEDANPKGYKLADANRDYTAHGRTVGYPTEARTPAGQWLRENPHTQPLPRIGFVLNDRAIAPADITAIDQRLDLWKGRLHSRVKLLGQALSVDSAVSPDSDTLALRIRSPLLAGGRVAVRIALPHGYGKAATHHNPPLDFSQPDAHRSTVLARGGKRLVVEHLRDASRYAMTLSSRGALKITQPEPHVFEIAPGTGDTLELTVSFAQDGIAPAREAAGVFKAAGAHWPAFWRRSS